MANPRKFSEKIALHNQKQAEETAAFEAIMREVSGATRGGPVGGLAGYQLPKQHLHISHPNLGAYRGGSLPNVNQLAGNNTIDLQSALHNLEQMKHDHGRQMLVDRLQHRSRSRELAGHRRQFPGARVDHSPYGNAYLSPPPVGDGWRRTNSDSALHQSAMAPQDQLSPNTPPPPRRMEMIGEMQGENMGMKNYWDPKKISQSRPKSCEVPGINDSNFPISRANWQLRDRLRLRGGMGYNNDLMKIWDQFIYPSQDQDPGGPHIPISNNTGSLPDLTNLHFPPPLITPLDSDDQQQQQQQQTQQQNQQQQNYSAQGSPASLSPTTAHHMNMAPPQQSPVQRRRSPQHTPSPLILGSPTQMRHSVPPQVPGDPRGHPTYQLYHQTSPVAQNGNHHQQNTSQNHHHHHSHMPNNHKSTQQMSGYRNSNPSSPTSPLSQQSCSPTQSPGIPTTTASNNTPFFDAYYIQQQQTNALQHQFEHFNMQHPQDPLNQPQDQPQSNQSLNQPSTFDGIVDQFDLLQDNLPVTSSMNNGVYQPTTQFSQAHMQGLSGSQEFQQNSNFNGFHPPADGQAQLQFSQAQLQGLTGSQELNHSRYYHTQGLNEQNSKHYNLGQQDGRIPDIILTGVDETLSRQDFAKDIGNAMAGMPDNFDSSELFPSDEALKAGLGPLDFEGLQILSDPNMVPADPATEDQLKLDNL